MRVHRIGNYHVSRMYSFSSDGAACFIHRNYRICDIVNRKLGIVLINYGKSRKLSFANCD